jgi:hypothetical protein
LATRPVRRSRATDPSGFSPAIFVVTTALAAALGGGGCSGAGEPSYTGGLSEPCNPGGTCDRGLLCIANVCRSSYLPGDPAGDPGPGDPAGGDALAGDAGGDSTATDQEPGDPQPGDPAPVIPECDDGSGLRPAVVPLPGEVVITEVFPDPTGLDANKEWVEVYVAAGHAVDLNGLTLTNTKLGSAPRSQLLTAASCLAANAGAYVVLAASLDSGLNGDLAADFSAPGLNMFNDTEMTVDLSFGPILIDLATLPSGREGYSVSLDPLEADASANDLAASFCAATTTGLFSGTGTPGAANDLCPWECDDGGTARRLVAPQVGELVITEIFPDPDGADDNHDWLEVYVAAAAEVDINGLVIENVNATPTTRLWTITSGDHSCITLAPASYHVIGGISVAQDGITSTGSLVGGETTLLFAGPAVLSVKADGAIVDTVQYEDPGELYSRSLDPTILDATQNDVAVNWCVAAAGDQFDSGTAYGSPGIANRTDCP